MSEKMCCKLILPDDEYPELLEAQRTIYTHDGLNFFVHETMFDRNVHHSDDVREGIKINVECYESSEFGLYPSLDGLIESGKLPEDARKQAVNLRKTLRIFYEKFEKIA